MALPTKGRVIVDTTVGEIDIELWSKETPRACRNFLALAMEGYYDGVIFHRVVPGFLVQTGDKTGTGAGGESFYGEPFEDEIHPRLRFAHRGLVAMANNGTKNSNDSQFFITLDRADELHGKHTLFGRCVGDTVYNVVKIGEMEIKDERPVYPPKIKGIRIIDNPFPDIIPRITAAERRAQQKAKEEAKREREEEERRRGAKKNVKLLSFGADEGGEEEEEPVVFKKKPIVRPDLIEEPESTNVATLPDFVTNPARSAREEDKDRVKSKSKDKDKDETDAADKKSSKKKDKKSPSDETDDLSRIRTQHALEKSSQLTARQVEIEKMEKEIRKLQKKRAGEEDSDEERNKKKQKKSYLEEELKKYEKGRGMKGKKGKKRDEGNTLEMMSMFRGKLQASWLDRDEDMDGNEEKEAEKEKEIGEDGLPSAPSLPNEEDPGQEIDDDFGFLSHELHFPKDDGEESRKAERDYEVIDPRVRGQRAREEERERKKKEARKFKDGGRGAMGRGGGGSGYRRDESGRR